jgi:hypothetical protein
LSRTVELHHDRYPASTPQHSRRGRRVLVHPRRALLLHPGATCGHGPSHVVYADHDGVLTRADLDESRRERLARERRSGYAERTKDGAAVEVGKVLGLGAPRRGFVVARIGPLSSPLGPRRVAYSAAGTGGTLGSSPHRAAGRVGSRPSPSHGPVA